MSQFSETEKLCFNCLSNTHMINTCKFKRHCQVDNCQKRHHTLLHSEEMLVPNSPDQIDSNINNIFERKTLSQTYLQIVLVTLTNSRRDMEVHTNALLDTGSDTTLIRKDIADKLKLNGIRRTMNMSNAVTNTRMISSQIVNFIITSQTNKCDCFNIDDAHVMNKLNIRHNKIDEIVMSKYEHLHDISLPKPNIGDITVLIGSDHPELLLHGEFKKGKPRDPVAVKRKLGWMLMGGKRQLGNRSQCNYLSEDNISESLERFWQIDTYGTLPEFNPDILPPEQKRGLHILESTTVIKDNKFEVGLLWKKDNIILP